MKRFVSTLFAAAALLMPPGAAAQDPAWPARPIRFIVAGGTGGVPDLRARWLADRLAPVLHQPIVVDDRPGAGGAIAMEQGARSVADGYTFVIVHQGVMTIRPHLLHDLRYDPLTDFAPVAQLGVAPLLLAVHPDVPAHSVAELIRLAKQKPGQLSFGSNGTGTPPHLAGELFKRAAGIDLTHVPYKGGGQAAGDLIAGHITLTLEGLTVQLPYVKSGRIRALAVTGTQRVDSLPDVPTMEEAGVAGYVYVGWVGVAAPAGVPREIVERLHREIVAITTSPQGRTWFAEVGAQPGDATPEAFGALIRAEHARWGRLIKEADIRLE
jgi:tripartite-type tricarboxylate transporter receptor subunit TctC